MQWRKCLSEEEYSRFAELVKKETEEQLSSPSELWRTVLDHADPLLSPVDKDAAKADAESWARVAVAKDITGASRS